jgi:uncharacterized protein (DUF1810 family)
MLVQGIVAGLKPQRWWFSFFPQLANMGNKLSCKAYLAVYLGELTAFLFW